MDAPLEFPAAFRWGAATAAHQIEGDCRDDHWRAWEQEGGHIADGSVSGVACDHWNRVVQDADRTRALGHDAQRPALVWSRIEPAEGERAVAALEIIQAPALTAALLARYCGARPETPRG